MDIHHISMGVMVCISMTVYNINLPQTPEIQPCWKPVRTLISWYFRTSRKSISLAVTLPVGRYNGCSRLWPELYRLSSGPDRSFCSIPVLLILIHRAEIQMTHTASACLRRWRALHVRPELECKCNVRTAAVLSWVGLAEIGVRFRGGRSRVCVSSRWGRGA